MKTLHIANINFEMLLDEPLPISLEESFALHPNLLQLQHLPKLYTDQPYLATCDAPYTFDAPPTEPHTILPWAHHPLIEAWSQEHNHHYLHPENIELYASKQFSFDHLPQLPGTKLVFNADDLHFTSYPVVLKTVYGFSGRGHKVYHKQPTPDRWMQKQWAKGRPLIAEPWVKVISNFSVQFENKQPIGVCELFNNPRGMFEGCDVNHGFKLPANFNPDPLIEKLNYDGPFGIDAFVWAGGCHINEINPRRTMGRVALDYAKGRKMSFRWCSEQESTTNLLPNHLFYKNRKVDFKLGFYATPL